MNLKNVDEMIFQPLGLKISNAEEDAECRGYSGISFTLNHLNVKFRTAKTTPTKTGQFVTLWKRNEKGETTPFDSDDHFDFYLISASREDNAGLFIFSKKILLEKNILTHEGKDGKRGFRVYPVWDITENKQAKATQKWQTACFIDASQDKETYLQKTESLLGLS
ncbi:MAG: MepB family protein [Chryseobacterium sp.]|jgi:hypothetical protein|uniref:MepB family protein n=1 Tax=Chryseobacterium sp. TaxID=1871047 RepID=UPI00282DACD3|nr:MepB family protein [Chryseobacterium sp.]MDR2236944.1 MepB family protein [Chryseobacterium sp.]